MCENNLQQHTVLLEVDGAEKFLGASALFGTELPLESPAPLALALADPANACTPLAARLLETELPQSTEQYNTFHVELTSAEPLVPCHVLERTRFCASRHARECRDGAWP